MLEFSIFKYNTLPSLPANMEQAINGGDTFWIEFHKNDVRLLSPFRMLHSDIFLRMYVYMALIGKWWRREIG